jgi:hypothetical protein
MGRSRTSGTRRLADAAIRKPNRGFNTRTLRRQSKSCAQSHARPPLALNMASDASHGDRAADLLRLADTRHRPTRSIQDALEAQVREGDDLVVASRDRPSMIAVNGVSVASFSAPLPCPRQAACRRRNANSLTDPVWASSRPAASNCGNVLVSMVGPVATTRIALQSGSRQQNAGDEPVLRQLSMFKWRRSLRGSSPLRQRHDPVAYMILERNEPRSPPANSEAWRSNYGRQQAFEPVSPNRKSPEMDRLLVVRFRL